MKPLIEEDLEIPKLDNKKIMAWGLLKGPDGKGINLLLIENENEIYGDWIMLLNNNSGLSMRDARPSPFPFEFNEIEKEIQLIYSTHIYNTDQIKLDINYILKFIGQYV